jgi:hypothetical protein
MSEPSLLQDTSSSVAAFRFGIGTMRAMKGRFEFGLSQDYSVLKGGDRCVITISHGLRQHLLTSPSSAKVDLKSPNSRFWPSSRYVSYIHHLYILNAR